MKSPLYLSMYFDSLPIVFRVLGSINIHAHITFILNPVYIKQGWVSKQIITRFGGGE